MILQVPLEPIENAAASEYAGARVACTRMHTSQVNPEGVAESEAICTDHGDGGTPALLVSVEPPFRINKHSVYMIKNKSTFVAGSTRGRTSQLR